MPVTKQTTQHSGGDASRQRRRSRQTATSDRNASAVDSSQHSDSDPVTTTSTRAAQKRITTESAVGQRQLSNEDFAFDIAFSLLITSPIPCKEIA